MRDGFKDATGDYGARDEARNPVLQTGVWLSDATLDPNEEANGDTVLEVTIDVAGVDFDEFEWVEEGKPYREWLIPAKTLNPLMIGIRIEGR